MKNTTRGGIFSKIHHIRVAMNDIAKLTDALFVNVKNQNGICLLKMYNKILFTKSL